jgi:hypothetical protein
MTHRTNFNARLLTSRHIPLGYSDRQTRHNPKRQKTVRDPIPWTV